MAALTAARQTPSRDLGVKRSYPVAASTTIYAGGLCMLNSGGYVVPAAAVASNQGCVGVATATVDNSSGSNGDKSAALQEGTFLLVGSSATQAMVGAKMYAADDAGGLDVTQASNEPVAGVGAEYVSATSMWIKVGLSESKL